MILIISICNEKLHELEFVFPIVKLLKEKNILFNILNYKSLKNYNFKNVDKIIISGTSLKDNLFMDYLDNFLFIKKFNKPILGICAGMQIISLIFGGKIKKKTEIGFYKENFKKGFLGLEGKHEVYHLHNNYVTLPFGFERFTTSSIPQAVKHKSRPIYGTLFHPEVRNFSLIEAFCKL